MATRGRCQSNVLVAKKASTWAANVGKDQAIPPPKRPPLATARVTIASLGPQIGAASSANLLKASLLLIGEGTSTPAHVLSAGRSTAVVNTNLAAEVASESAPVTASAHKKRKSRKGSKSSSKKCRREGKESAVPLPGGVFSPEYNVGRFIDFNRGPTYLALLESLPGCAMMDSVFEMASRTASMIGYIREFGDIWGSGEVKSLLLKDEEKTATLQAELEGARKALEEEKQRSAEGATKLEEAAKRL